MTWRFSWDEDEISGKWWVLRVSDGLVLVRGRIGDEREADCRLLVDLANTAHYSEQGIDELAALRRRVKALEDAIDEACDGCAAAQLIDPLRTPTVPLPAPTDVWEDCSHADSNGDRHACQVCFGSGEVRVMPPSSSEESGLSSRRSSFDSTGGSADARFSQPEGEK